jgi:hypothetical protein
MIKMEPMNEDTETEIKREEVRKTQTGRQTNRQFLL